MENEAWIHAWEDDHTVHISANAKGLEDLSNSILLKLKFKDDVVVVIGDDFYHKLIKIDLITDLKREDI